MFQDDVARLCLTVSGAQAGNDRISIIMNLKQLKINVDKSFYTLIGSQRRVQEIRTLTENKPLLFQGKKIEEKPYQKYLSEQVHSEGLAKTVETTVSKRYWLAMSLIMEIQTIINDYTELTQLVE